MRGTKTCVQCMLCEVMHAKSTSSTSIEYCKQQYCTMLVIGWLTADVTLSQKHLGVNLVEFSIAHISCSVSYIELKIGTNDEEDITQQIITLRISMLGIFWALVVKYSCCSIILSYLRPSTCCALYTDVFLVREKFGLFSLCLSTAKPY